MDTTEYHVTEINSYNVYNRYNGSRLSQNWVRDNLDTKQKPTTVNNWIPA